MEIWRRENRNLEANIFKFLCSLLFSALPHQTRSPLKLTFGCFIQTMIMNYIRLKCYLSQGDDDGDHGGDDGA